ncbi:MAG: hypothetical protein ACYS21_08300 [Planctomycetota bacterium]
MAATWQGWAKGTGGLCFVLCCCWIDSAEVGHEILARGRDVAKGRWIFVLDGHTISV